MSKKSKNRTSASDAAPTASAPPLRNQAFAQLGALRSRLPVGGEPTAAGRPAAPATATPAVAPGPKRAVVRYERKGRGGKEATVIEQLGLDAAALARWCAELKSALGCGGAVEGGTLVLQGDQRKRLPTLLTARGVGKITVS